MKKLALPTRSSGSPASPRAPGTALRDPNAPLPKISNRLTDADIPNSAWSAWTPSDGARQLRRALTAEERSALEARARELAPVCAPFGPAESDAVGVALADMFGSYRSMRQTGEEAYALLISTRRTLEGYSLWAIQQGCRSIQMDGVWRDGKFDKRWAPNDAEIVEAIRQKARLYSDQHRSAVALLSATVEER